MPTKLILAHGALGFGSNPFLKLVGIDYFRKIFESIDQDVIEVLEPSVNPVGTVNSRAKDLVIFINDKTEPTDEVHILAHSMGGLDARRVILDKNNENIRERIKTLVTIGTPHKGSEVADAIIKGTKITPQLEPIVALLPDKLRGLSDLTTAECKKYLNEDWSGIAIQKYCIAGNPKSANPPRKLSKLLYLASKLGGIENKASDGVVTRESALLEGWQHLDDWPADHTELIGLNLDNPFSVASDYIDRYISLIEKITGMKKEDFYKD